MDVYLHFSFVVTWCTWRLRNESISCLRSPIKFLKNSKTQKAQECNALSCHTRRRLCYRHNLLLLAMLCVCAFQGLVYFSMAIQSFGPWQFFTFLIFTQPVGLLGRGISPWQGRYLQTEQHNHRIKAHRNPCLKWESNP
jgi:hypothetical protein